MPERRPRLVIDVTEERLQEVRELAPAGQQGILLNMLLEQFMNIVQATGERHEQQRVIYRFLARDVRVILQEGEELYDEAGRLSERSKGAIHGPTAREVADYQAKQEAAATSTSSLANEDQGQD